MRLVKNVAGVDGLHIALDAFGEAAERRLFESQRIHAPQESHGPNSDADGRRAGRCHRPLPDDVDLFRVCNLVGDCGLYPGYVTPDYVYAITYPPKAAFNKHLDSRYRWGETVVGVTLGQAGTVYFEPNTQAIKAAGRGYLDRRQHEGRVRRAIKNLKLNGAVDTLRAAAVADISAATTEVAANTLPMPVAAPKKRAIKDTNAPEWAALPEAGGERYRVSSPSLAFRLFAIYLTLPACSNRPRTNGRRHNTRQRQ